jgi:RNA polymerase sigma-70 factor (ECF subfamily)
MTKQSETGGSPLFPETLWTLLLEPIRNRSPEAQVALEALCERYRKPLLKLACLSVQNYQDAEDITHDFLLSLLRRDDLAKMDRAKGKFRTFLGKSLRHFILNWRRNNGRPLHVPMDHIAEAALVAEEHAEREFDQEWARTMMEQAKADVAAWYRKRNKSSWYDLLVRLLPGADPPILQAEVAATLKISLNQVRVEYHRFREKLEHAVRRQVTVTVGSPEEVDVELQHLKNCLGGA